MKRILIFATLGILLAPLFLFSLRAARVRAQDFERPATLERARSFIHRSEAVVPQEVVPPEFPARPAFAVAVARQESKTNKALRALSMAETDEEKREAERDLRRALEAEYEASLEAYQKNLEKLRDRLEQLSDELERRRDAMDELVDLRLKVLVNQANGLGWPSDRGFSRSGFNDFVPFAVPSPGSSSRFLFEDDTIEPPPMPHQVPDSPRDRPPASRLQ